MSVPVAAARGSSQIPSSGWICSGLVQMAFWSNKIRRGVPAKVIDSGFDIAGGGVGSLWGSGASGSEVAVAGAFSGWALCAKQNRSTGSKKQVARQTAAVSLGGVRGIVRHGRQLTCNPLLEATIGDRLVGRSDSYRKCHFFAWPMFSLPLPWSI